MWRETALACCFLVGCQTRPPEVSAKTASQPNDNWERTKDCAKQAKEDFESLDYRKRGILADYKNHYNHEMGKCFIFIEETDTKTVPGEIWTAKSLYDAYERKGYAAYSWKVDKTKKFWEVPPVECHVILPSGEKKTCTSDEEFTRLTDAYMNRD